ncbi:hypothetical protein ABZ917_41155 [Nonomuraea wenchangensis]
MERPEKMAAALERVAATGLRMMGTTAARLPLRPARRPRRSLTSVGPA